MERLAIHLRFTLYAFVVAVFINSAVVASHILTVNEYNFTDSLIVVAYATGVSLLFFTAEFIVIAILATFYKNKPAEHAFWMILMFGCISTLVLYLLLRSLFAVYLDEPIMMGSVALFSILISISSQYPLYTEHNQAECL